MQNRNNILTIAVLSEALTGEWDRPDNVVVASMREAEVIIGTDGEKEVLVYGVEVLDRIVSRGAFIEGRPTSVLRVSLNFDEQVDDLETILSRESVQSAVPE